MLFSFELALLAIRDRVWGARLLVGTGGAFHGAAGVVLEVLVDAARRYDAATDATEAATGKAWPIVGQVARYVLVEVLILTCSAQWNHSCAADIWIIRHGTLVLVDRIESRSTAWHGKQTHGLALGNLIVHVWYSQMSSRLHTVRVIILIVCVHLLLFLIESAAKTATELVGASLADVGLRVRDTCWTTGSLVLQVCIVLIDHLVQEVVIYQIALTVWILLICSDRCCDVISLEADGRSVLALIVVELAREFGSERRLLCYLLVRSLVLVLDWLIRVVLVTSLEDLE